MKPPKFTFLAAFMGTCAIATAQPASQTSGPAEPRLDPTSHSRFDTNRDGKLDEAETAAMNAQMKAMAERRQAMTLKKYDKDGDGKLSEEETAAMKKDRMERERMRRQKMMEIYDKDKDGELSAEEMKAMREELAKKRAKLLKTYDKNKNGVLDIDEMEAAAKAGDMGPDDMWDDSWHGQPQRKGSNSASD